MYEILYIYKPFDISNFLHLWVKSTNLHQGCILSFIASDHDPFQGHSTTFCMKTLDIYVTFSTFELQSTDLEHGCIPWKPSLRMTTSDRWPFFKITAYLQKHWGISLLYNNLTVMGDLEQEFKKKVLLKHLLLKNGDEHYDHLVLIKFCTLDYYTGTSP